MARIILVHGAMHGGWCWQPILPLLATRGHDAVAIDLPGAQGELPPADISLSRYTDEVIAALDAAPAPALLIGHSLGGMAISAAAEARADRVSRLVYLCALLPIDGESTMDLLSVNPDQSVIGDFEFAADGLSYSLPPARRRAILYHDCPDDLAVPALDRLVPQALRMTQDPVDLTEDRFGRVHKTYVETLDDAAVHLPFQRAMIARYPDIAVESLDCAHSPFFACPEKLADLIDAETRR
ncbi:alpha/beta fold hydrolase [Sphingomonas sp. 1P06PA]|uniref:alpha/beta fold hydrolase n=1 Tax=Sphingomonas sp. 1P06PA TaxID=554121 RepID=UPI0039A638C9